MSLSQWSTPIVDAPSADSDDDECGSGETKTAWRVRALVVACDGVWDLLEPRLVAQHLLASCSLVAAAAADDLDLDAPSSGAVNASAMRGGEQHDDGWQACAGRPSSRPATLASTTSGVRVRLRCRDAAVRIRDDALRRGSRDNVSLVVCATFEGACIAPPTPNESLSAVVLSLLPCILDATHVCFFLKKLANNESTTSLTTNEVLRTATMAAVAAENEVAAAKRRRRAAEVRRIVSGYARARDARVALDSARLADAELARRRRAASAFGPLWLDKSSSPPSSSVSSFTELPSTATSQSSTSSELVLSLSADESALIGYLRDPQIGVVARARSVDASSADDTDTFSARVRLFSLAAHVA